MYVYTYIHIYIYVYILCIIQHVMLCYIVCDWHGARPTQVRWADDPVTGRPTFVNTLDM